MNYFSLFVKKTLRYLLKPLSFVPAFCMLYFILYMSSQEGTASTTMSYEVSKTLVLMYNKLFSKGLSNEMLNNLIYELHPFIRKTAHFTEFFVLAVTVAFPLYVYKIRGIFLIILGELLCVGVAFLDEYSQSFVLGRNPSYRDVMIDSTGALLGILIAWILCYIGRKTVFKWLSLEDYRRKKKEYHKKIRQEKQEKHRIH
ncbi:MAG: VanZ family protein [Lachnospiraceae bacterium]|nr:VanZ family protein [Lachnospiraceae bacterium]